MEATAAASIRASATRFDSSRDASTVLVQSSAEHLRLVVFVGFRDPLGVEQAVELRLLLSVQATPGVLEARGVPRLPRPAPASLLFLPHSYASSIASNYFATLLWDSSTDLGSALDESDSQRKSPS